MSKVVLAAVNTLVPVATAYQEVSMCHLMNQSGKKGFSTPLLVLRVTMELIVEFDNDPREGLSWSAGDTMVLWRNVRPPQMNMTSENSTKEFLV